MKPFFLLALLFLAQKSLAQTRGAFYDEVQKKYGLAEPETGEPMTAPIFENAFFIEGTDSLVYAKTATGFGVFSMTGRVVVPPMYYSIYHNRTGAGASGFADVMLNSLTGLARLSDGKIVLPPEFKVVGAFSPTRVFGRRDGSKMIEVFDQNGQKTSEFEGLAAHRHGQTSLFGVIKEDFSYSLVDESGRDFSKGAVAVGSAKIFQSLDKNGGPNTAFLINEWGDTLHKNAFEIREIAFNRFLVGFKNKPFSRFGLCDETGKWLIEPTEKTFKTLGERLSPSGVLVAADGKGNEQIYRKNGQLLIDSCRIGSILVDREVTRRAKNSAADRFFTVEKIGRKGSLGLFKFNGELVLPMEFSSIVCATNEHALIAAKPRKERGFSYNAFDIETGRKLFEEDFEELRFTLDPHVFWARMGRLWCLVNYQNYRYYPPNYLFSTIIKLPSAYFLAVKQGKYQLFDPFGKNLVDGGFSEIRKPERGDFEDFFKKINLRGRLVAVGIRGSELSTWHGIAADGTSITFTKEDYPRTFEVEVSSEAPDMEKMDEPIPPPPLSAVPDEIMTMVEKWPVFPGGEAALLAFLNKNLKYPAMAKENSIVGKVIVQFVVEKDGSLTDLGVLRDIGGGCGKEAVRLVRLMPKWTAGRQNGQPVRVRYFLPVQFHLD